MDRQNSVNYRSNSKNAELNFQDLDMKDTNLQSIEEDNEAQEI